MFWKNDLSYGQPARFYSRDRQTSISMYVGKHSNQGLISVGSIKNVEWLHREGLDLFLVTLGSSLRRAFYNL